MIIKWIARWLRGHIEIHIFGPNQEIIAQACVCTEFDTVPENVAPEPDLRLVVTCAEIQDGSCCHFVIG